ncbi:Protein containing kinase domain [Brazilian cedratvirus IHUMI]|uniref:Protein containing kinase domain n=1 Tax=Brazilian cedratvirus IHUMI TaxID=2126980 RepID=A0A2R8FDT9_9VIRU|nr:Protein containing kinase domain [Brazilian cedratvirus IHUMI]
MEEGRTFWYRHLSSRLHACVDSVLKDFIKEESVIEFVSLSSETTSELYRVAVLCSIPTTRLFEKEFLSRVCCYHYLKPDKYYFLERVLRKGQYVRIGFTSKEPLSSRPPRSCSSVPERKSSLVVKWFRNQDMDITFEMGLYTRLKLLGCPLPYFSCSYRFWKDKVLLLEELQSLDKEDDPCNIGICVLEQLSYLHTFAVHTDIKPNNIMRKGRKYYLIDFGGVALEKLNYGYKRWNWSEKWTSQKMYVKNQITTYKNDLIELGYTLNHLEGKEDARSGFTEKLAQYMNEVRKLDPEVQPGDELYAHLKSILAK